MKKIPRWAQILIGIAIVAVFLGIGAVIAITAWVSQNLDVSTTTAQEAEAEFEKVRQLFKDKPALLEVKDGVTQFAAARASEAASEQPLEALHVLVWEPEDDKLARVRIPWWILRMKSGAIRFSSYASGFDDEGVKVTPAEIEKRGPGIVMEASGRHGERVLLWAQ